MTSPSFLLLFYCLANALFDVVYNRQILSKRHILFELSRTKIVFVDCPQVIQLPGYVISNLNVL